MCMHQRVYTYRVGIHVCGCVPSIRLTSMGQLMRAGHYRHFYLKKNAKPELPKPTLYATWLMNQLAGGYLQASTVPPPFLNPFSRLGLLYRCRCIPKKRGTVRACRCHTLADRITLTRSNLQVATPWLSSKLRVVHCSQRHICMYPRQHCTGSYSFKACRQR